MKKASPQTFAGAEGAKREQEYRAKILESLIQVALLRQGAKDLGIAIDTKQVDSYLKQIEQQYGGAKGLADALKQAGIDVQQLRKTSEDRLLVEAVTKKIAKTTAFSEKQLKDYYDQNKSLFAGTDQVHVVQILLKSADEKLAKDLFARVKKGEAITALARKYSQDPGSKDRSGDLGWAPPNKYMPAMQAKLQVMKPGEFALVETQYGWHVFKLDGRRGAQTRPFAEVKQQIKLVLQQRTDADAFTKFLDTLRKKADIQILDAELKKLVEGSQAQTTK